MLLNQDQDLLADLSIAICSSYFSLFNYFIASECWTKNDPHLVEDDVAHCQTVQEEKCVEVNMNGYFFNLYQEIFSKISILIFTSVNILIFDMSHQYSKHPSTTQNKISHFRNMI